MAPKRLTPRQQRFVDTYAGNATEAALVAGYSTKGAKQIAHKLMAKPAVAAAIAARESVRSSATIATREERQAFWTTTVRNHALAMSDRLRASELLGKSEADFTEKVQHGGGVVINVVDPYAEPKK